MSDHSDHVLNWATGGAGEGEPALSSADIQANIEGDIALLGSLVFDFDDIPAGASERPNGTFSSYDDLYQYLENGGLVIINPDTGEPTPNPLVVIYAHYNDEYDSYEYETWIDENY